ncbi:MAG: hypothetical protein AVO35_08290 [Candidatus Aegiribacteria sp. MLS_C]|nr:MAG: hypothetical protein AVO35_08290 [Candidatus Aegiribacteria sp. MLS_C]
MIMQYSKADGNGRTYLKGFREPEGDFFRSGAVQLARELIGCLLRRETARGPLSGMIVETEAYTADDPASHSFRGRTSRNWPMFEGGGLAYVYLIYGVHNCFNVTAGKEGSGQAVLVRALHPMEGLGIMRANRGGGPESRFCSGPGKLCQALDIDRRFNGVRLGEGGLGLLVPDGGRGHSISVDRRIGISRGTDLGRRFLLEGSPWVSRGRRPDPAVTEEYPEGQDGQSYPFEDREEGVHVPVKRAT